MSPAPVALFVYNRPLHTRQTIDALAANLLAEQTALFVFSDGARDAAASSSVAQVRELVRDVRGFASVQVIERESNVGLARSIIEGVSWLCREHGRAIVVEDDLVTSNRFLQYVNGALVHYEHDEAVMHVSGYMYPASTEGLPETFFLPTTSCWGWGTWQRAWQHFHKDPAELQRRFTADQRRAFNLDQSFPYWTQVDLNARGVLDTWAIFWYASVFLRGGLCLHPRHSFVRNIGHDDSGVHSARSRAFDVSLSTKQVAQWSDDLQVHPQALQRLKSYFRSTTSLRVRARMRLESLIDRARTPADAETGP